MRNQRAHHQDQHQRGNGGERLDQARHEGVHQASPETRQPPEHDAERDQHQRAQQPQAQGRSGAVHHAREEIAAQGVGAQGMSGREGREQGLGVARRLRGAVRHQRRDRPVSGGAIARPGRY